MSMDDAVDVRASGMNGAVNREARLIYMRTLGRDHFAVDVDAHQRRRGDLFEHGSEAIDQEMIMRSRNARGNVRIDDVVHALESDQAIACGEVTGCLPFPQLDLERPA